MLVCLLSAEVTASQNPVCSALKTAVLCIISVAGEACSFALSGPEASVPPRGQTQGLLI